MEGITRKLRWDVYRRVDKHIPHTNPSWWSRREIANEINEIIVPAKEQLREDAEWKK